MVFGALQGLAELKRRVVGDSGQPEVSYVWNGLWVGGNLSCAWGGKKRELRMGWDGKN
mgnify:CR=1 FL=1